MNDGLVCLIFVHRLEVLAEKPDERVEPLECLYCFEQEEVVCVPLSDVLLLVGEDILTVVLIVLHAHHNVAEDAEGGDFAFLENHCIALAVGVAQSSSQVSCERDDLNEGDDEHHTNACPIDICDYGYPCEGLSNGFLCLCLLLELLGCSGCHNDFL